MNADTSTYTHPTPHATIKTSSLDQPVAWSPLNRISWGAVIAGLMAAIALETLFMMLGSGLDFAIYNPLSDHNSITSLGTGAAVIQGVSAVISLWFGGWVSGRFAPVTLTRGNGVLHGFTVWTTGTVAGILLVAVGASVAMTGLSKVAGEGMSLAGKVTETAGDAAAELTSVGLRQPAEMFKSFSDEALPGSAADRNNPGVSIRAQREVGMAVVRYFNANTVTETTEHRATLKSALMEYGALSDQAAETMIQDWTRSYENFKTDIAAFKQNAEMKARAAAEKSAEVLSALSIAYFVAFALGAFAACMGGAAGARHAQKCTMVHAAV